MLLVLATPMLSYGRLLFEPPLTALCLTVGVAWIARPPKVRRDWFVFAGGMLAGAAVVVEYAAVFAALPIGAYLGWRAWRDRDVRTLLLATAGALVPIAGLAAYHAAVFGSPLSTGYHHVVRAKFAQTHAKGLLGLGLPTATSIYEHMLSPWGGLAYWAPLWVVATGWAAARWRELDDEARLGAAIFGLMLLVNLGLSQTGGWRVGPRYLVGFFPLLVPALARMLEAAVRRPSLGAGIVALVGWSVAANFLAAHLFPHLIDKGNPLADQLVPMWLDGLAPYNWLAPILGERLALHGLAGLAVGVTAWSLSRLPWPARGRRVGFGLGFVAAVLLFSAALTLPAAEDAEANLTAIERIWEPTASGQRITTMIRPLPE